MNKLNILVQLDINPGYGTEVRKMLSEFCAQSQSETGLDFMHIMENADNELQLFIIERWEDMPSYEDHICSPHFLAFGDAIHDKLNMTIRNLLPIK